MTSMSKPHRWTALGSAGLTTEQATGWTQAADHQPVTEPLTVDFHMVVCAVCLDHLDDADATTCPGPPEGHADDHLWLAHLAAMLTPDQADAWTQPDADVDPGFPQAVAVTCLLCGADADDAPAACPERQLWAA